MNSLIRFSPNTEMRRLQREIDRVFEGFFPDENGERAQRAVWSPRVDLTETPDDFVIHADMPGIDKDDLDINYEPLGVAVFALGALYLSGGAFVSVGHLGRIHVMDALDDVVLVLDTDDRLRRCNPAAAATFPPLAEARGRPLEALCPRLAESLTADGVVELPRPDGPGSFLVKTSELRVGTVRVGTVVVATDVTEIEHGRAELARQNRQLEEFAVAIDHELRNAAAVVSGHGELALSRLDAAEDEAAMVHDAAHRLVERGSEPAALRRQVDEGDGVGHPCADRKGAGPWRGGRGGSGRGTGGRRLLVGHGDRLVHSSQAASAPAGSGASTGPRTRASRRSG